MAETTIKPYNLSVAKNIIGPLAQTSHYLVTFSALTPSVESYLADYTRIPNIRSFAVIFSDKFPFILISMFFALF